MGHAALGYALLTGGYYLRLPLWIGQPSLWVKTKRVAANAPLKALVAIAGLTHPFDVVLGTWWNRGFHSASVLECIS